MFSEHTSSRTKADAAYEATEALGPARARKMRGASATRSATRQPWPRRTVRMNATQDVLGKAEALEKHVETVTMRAGSFFTTESDFPQTILEQHEKPWNAVERAVSTAAYGGCRTKSRLSIAKNAGICSLNAAFCLSHEMTHECVLPQMFDDDSESDRVRFLTSSTRGPRHWLRREQATRPVSGRCQATGSD